MASNSKVNIKDSSDVPYMDLEELKNLYKSGNSDVSFYDMKTSDPRWGKVMRSGKMFDENAETAAVPEEAYDQLKGKFIKVTMNGKTKVFPITDSGGFLKYNRTADLSKKAFANFADTKTGVLKGAKVEIVDGK